MKREYLLSGVAAAVVIIGSVAFFVSKGPDKMELTISQISELKSSAQRIGNYIGVLAACSSDERISSTMNDTLKRLMIDPSKNLTPDQVKSKVLEAMDESGIGSDVLNQIDDIIRESQSDSQQRAAAQIGIDRAGSLNFCVPVVTQSPVFDKEQVLPEDPVERINTFAKISPLSQ